MPPLPLVWVRGEPLLHTFVAPEIEASADGTCDHLGWQTAIHPLEAEPLDGLLDISTVDLETGLGAVRRTKDQRAEHPSKATRDKGMRKPTELIVLGKLSFEALVEGKYEGDHAAIHQKTHLNSAVESEESKLIQRRAWVHILRLPVDFHSVEWKGHDRGRGAGEP